MTAIDVNKVAVTTAPRRRSALRAMTVVEARLFLRDPAGTFFGVLFPPVLILVLGSAIPGFRDPDPELGGRSVIDLYLPIAIAMSIGTVALVTLAAALSSYREKGVLRRLATTPARPYGVIAANLLVQGAALVVSIALTIGIGTVVLDVDLPGSWSGVLVGVVLGTTSMCAVGALVAAVSPTTRAASGIGTVVYFPMLFFAGVWTPGPTMPDIAQRIADLLPLGAASAALQDAWSGAFPEPLHLAVMAAWTLACGAAAARLFRWE